jgi:hypothetical protein
MGSLFQTFDIVCLANSTCSTIASNFIAHWIDVVVKMCGYSMKVEGKRVMVLVHESSSNIFRVLRPVAKEFVGPSEIG